MFPLIPLPLAQFQINSPTLAEELPFSPVSQVEDDLAVEFAESESNQTEVNAISHDGSIIHSQTRARNLPISSILVKFLDDSGNSVEDEALEIEIRLLFPLKVSEQFNPILAEEGILEIKDLKEVRQASYQTVLGKLPNHVNVLITVELEASPPDTKTAQPTGVFVTGDVREFPLFYRDRTLKVTGNLSGASGVFPTYQPWFGNPTQFSNLNGQPLTSPFPSSLTNENYIELGFSGKAKFSEWLTFRTGLSYAVTNTIGLDIFQNKNTTAGEFQEALIGLEITDQNEKITPWKVDLSVGTQDYVIGTGFLIGQGTEDGGERGVLFLNPLNSFLNTAIARIRVGDFKIQGFNLESNPLPQSGTKTNLAGINLEYTQSDFLHLGITYIKIPFSQVDTRNDMDIYNARFWVAPEGDSPGLWLAGEFAYETQSQANVQANGWYLQFGYNFSDSPWKPSFNYQFAYFSGDNPNTPNINEQFDSLYYSSNWQLGSIFSNVVSNEDQITHQFTFTLQPTDKFSLSFNYFLFFTPQPANLLNSPLATGDLGSEFDLTAQYQFNDKLSLGTTLALAFPGSGFAQAPGFKQVNTWSFFGIIFNWSF